VTLLTQGAEILCGSKFSKKITFVKVCVCVFFFVEFETTCGLHEICI
jgi:hypothetical protein